MDLLVQVYIYGLGGSSFHLWTCWFKFSSMDLLVLLRFFFSVLLYVVYLVELLQIQQGSYLLIHVTFLEQLKYGGNKSLNDTQPSLNL